MIQPEYCKESDFKELIHVDFSPKTFEGIFLDIKYNGVKRAYLNLLKAGFLESVAKAKIKRVIGTRGW